jgi:hypothetical protein
MLYQMTSKLPTHHSLNQFRQEGKKRYRTVVVEIIRAERGLFQEGSNIGYLHLIWKNSIGNRHVDN